MSKYKKHRLWPTAANNHLIVANLPDRHDCCLYWLCIKTAQALVNAVWQIAGAISTKAIVNDNHSHVKLILAKRF